MLGIKKKVHGIELIEEVTNRFITMIGELEKGAKDCEHECAGNQTQIQLLNQRNTELSNSIKRAEALASNLSNLIS